MTARERLARQLHALGLEHRDADEWAKAKATFDAARDAFEQAPDGDPGELGMTLHELAAANVQLGEIEQALSLYEEALRLKELVPTHVQRWDDFSKTLHELGYVQSRLGLHDEALLNFHAALAANENIVDAALRRSADESTLHGISLIHVEREAWPALVDTINCWLAAFSGAGSDPAQMARKLYWLTYASIELEDWKTANRSALESLRLFESIPEVERNPDYYAQILDELAYLARHRRYRSDNEKARRAARSASRRIKHPPLGGD